jgi:hypothetical protein
MVESRRESQPLPQPISNISRGFFFSLNDQLIFARSLFATSILCNEYALAKWKGAEPLLHPSKYGFPFA